jgi:hypothetical protein
MNFVLLALSCELLYYLPQHLEVISGDRSFVPGYTASAKKNKSRKRIKCLGKWHNQKSTFCIFKVYCTYILYPWKRSHCYLIFFVHVDIYLW